MGTVAYQATTGQELWRTRYAPPRSDDLASSLVLSPSGATAFVVVSSSPTISYTDLEELVTLAYRVADGSIRWQSHLDAGAGSSMSAGGVATGKGSAVVLGQSLPTTSRPPLVIMVSWS